MALATSAILGVLAFALTLAPDARRAEVTAFPSVAAQQATIAESGPADTTVAPDAVAFADPPTPVATPDDAAPESASPAPPADASPCADALSWVAAAGLALPAGVGYHCPSTQFAHQGAACWKGAPCPGPGFIAVNMDLLQGTSTAHLRHVVAHEICHILEFQAAGRTTEASADACAAAYGAPG